MPAHVATAQQMRQSCNHAAQILARVSVKRALQPGGKDVALVCQWTADVYRMMAEMWRIAQSRPDPHVFFFETAAAVIKATDTNALSEANPLERSREAFRRAGGIRNVPVVFPPAPHVARLDGIDLEAIVERVTQGTDPALFADETLSKAAASATIRPAARARLAIYAYLVDVSRLTGDHSMVLASARLAVIEEIARSSAAADFRREILRFLGPVESVRLRPYLRRAGL